MLFDGVVLHDRTHMGRIISGDPYIHGGGKLCSVSELNMLCMCVCVSVNKPEISWLFMFFFQM